jgi:5S rRNA maturation endonuclease (ribonuclease M5)
VEGKKDEETLRQLGITGTIINAKTGGQSLYTLTQAIIAKHPREVILLLDFDRRGKEATNYLKTQLERARIIPNLKYWAQTERTVGKEVKDIEGLASYMETLKRKLYH